MGVPWMRKRRHQTIPTRRDRRSGARSFRYRPRLEPLEDRTVPTIVWSPHFGAETTLDHQGNRLSSPPVYFIFWGSYWGDSNHEGASLRLSFLQAAQDILATSYLSGLTEYSIPTQPLDGHATYGGFAYVPADPSSSGFSVKDLGDLVLKVIGDSSSGIPSPSSTPFEPLYLVLTPPGINATDAPEAGGYHTVDPTNPETLFGWIGNDRTLQNLTYVMSHEIAEAITDPGVSGDPGITIEHGAMWTGGGSNEVSDAEAQNYSFKLRTPDGNFVVESYWSLNTTNVDGDFGAYIVPDGTTEKFYVKDGVLTLKGDQGGYGQKDHIVIGGDPFDLQVTIDGQSVIFDDNAVTGIVVQGGGGNDTIDVLGLHTNHQITINLGAGDDTVNFTPTSQNLSSASTTAGITINGGTGKDTVNLHDEQFDHDTTWTLTDGNVTRIEYPTTGTAPSINFNHIANLNIYGGSGNTTYNLQSAHGFATTLSTNNGNDAVNIDQTGALSPVTIMLGTGTDTVSLGPTAHSMQNLLGAVSVTGGGGNDTLKADDLSDAQSVGWTIYQDKFSSSIPDSTDITYSGLSALQIIGGNAKNVYDVRGTGAPTTIQTGSYDDQVGVRATGQPLTLDSRGGSDTVIVGDNAPALGGSLAGINGTVTVTAHNGFSNLTIDDGGDTTQRANVVLDRFTDSHGKLFESVTGLAATIYIADNDVFRAMIDGGTPTAPLGNIYSVRDTTPNTVFTLNAGGGPDVVTVHGTSGALTVAGGTGPLTVTVGDATNGVGHVASGLTVSHAASLTVDDSADMGTQSVTLDDHTLNGFSGTTSPWLTYMQVAALSLEGGTPTGAGNTFAGTFPGDFGLALTLSGFANARLDVTGNFLGSFLAAAEGTAATPVQAVNVHGAVAAGGTIKVNFLATLSVDGDLAGTVKGFGNSGSQASPTIGTITVGGALPVGGSITAPILGSWHIAGNQGGAVTESNPTLDMQDVTIGGSLLASATISAAAINSLAVTGDLAGQVSVATALNSLTVGGTLSGSVTAAIIGSAIITGDLSGSLTATQSLGTFSVGGDITGSVTAPFIAHAVVNGTNHDDVIVVTPNSVTINGHQGLTAMFGTLTVNGRAGNDLFVINGVVPATLNGGDGDDTFQFMNGAATTGSIDGQGGTNMLGYSMYTGDVTVDLPLGTATAVGGGVAHIQNVLGSIGHDVLVGDAGPNVFRGGTLASLLIGGAGADQLSAGPAGDILVSGPTAYDSNPTALAAIESEWTRTDLSYEMRVNHIMDGGGRNSPNLLNKFTVSDDGAVDALTGGAGKDLFFANNQQDTLVGKTAGEKVVNLQGGTNPPNQKLTAVGVAASDTPQLVTSSASLLTSVLFVTVQDDVGALDPAVHARIDDAFATLNAELGPLGVELMEVDPSSAAPDITIDINTTSPAGGMADGVLGCETGGGITLIAGWSWYTGSDPSQVSAGQYDLQTIVTHELGHSLGLGHSADPGSAMYATLDTGAVRRGLTAADLNVIEAADTGACALHAALPRATDLIIASAELATAARPSVPTVFEDASAAEVVHTLDRMFLLPNAADSVPAVVNSGGSPASTASAALRHGGGPLAAELDPFFALAWLDNDPTAG
jgi:hypothetical protein